MGYRPRGETPVSEKLDSQARAQSRIPQGEPSTTKATVTKRGRGRPRLHNSDIAISIHVEPAIMAWLTQQAKLHRVCRSAMVRSCVDRARHMPPGVFTIPKYEWRTPPVWTHKHLGRLSADSVLAIRARRNEPATMLAAEYKVGLTTVYAIWNRTTWRHL